MKNSRKRFLSSLLTLVLCITMFIGATFAWFTDSVSSSGNIIKSGNLDIEMYWTDDLNRGTWYNVEDPEHNTIFGYDKWEPGYTEVRYIKIVNNGNLALNYDLTLTPQNGVGKLAEVINVYFADSEVEIQGREDLSKLGAIGLLNNVLDGGATASGTLLAANQSSPLHKSGETIVTMAMTMITTAGNDYQEESVGDFTITALATQAPYEQDSFGSNYDSNAEMPAMLTPGKVSADVTPDNGKVPSGGVNLSGEGISAFVPAGVAMKDGANKLTLSITPLKNTTSDITVVNNEILIPVDVHIEGVAEDNTVPIVIELGEVLPKYMNMGNYHLFHVEDGTTSQMTLVNDVSELTAHNTFTYDPLTGEVSVAMDSFSEVTMLADTSNAWEGNTDVSWYDANKTELNIANADQLHAFSQIVGGIASGIERDSFEGKTVKLLSDINLNHGNVVSEGEKENATTTIFYPIGYNNNKDFVSAKNNNRPTNLETDVESTVYSFEGNFDGDGHKISNFYQNTWEMFGDYNDGYSKNSNYYKDAMGLFGYVVNGTVKNLTVDHFESDGEFTPTGVVAAYAVNSTFENIAITYCNPRVYNTGNGGIIGIAGREKEAVEAITLKNITVDNSNIISALWGSWDVACGGLIGMYRGNADANGNHTGDTVSFENCHVAAQIDVYNDVCANYQYYAYRYAGMIIGSIRHNTTNEEGKVIPNMKGISATGCTVNYGTWNDYYYCEFEKNSLASYSEDYQFSRISHSELAFTDANGNGKIDTVDERNSVTGCTHSHTSEEDKQAVYLPFHQLFTGYSWGVNSIGLKEYSGIVTDLDIIEGDQNESAKKFESKFKGNFLYRVGNGNVVSVDSLFAAKDGVTINNSGVYVSVDKIDENSNVSGTFKPNTTDWMKGTIEFFGTGVVKVTIQDYDFCQPTVLYLEVVDAYNVTTASGGDYPLKNRNSVLLNNITMASNGNFWLENATLYGNGFEFDVTAGKDGDTTNGYIGGNYAVALKNAILDNIQIIGEVYTKYGATAKSQYNYPTILTNGNSIIANSYVSNGSSAVRAQDGNLQIINSTLEGGIFANLDIRGGIVKLDNVITINQSTADGKSTTNDKGIVGLGIVFYECNLSAKLYVEKDASGNPSLTQYNCISSNTKFNDNIAEQLRTEMFKSKYADLQYTDSNGVTWINPCILSITEGIGAGNIDVLEGYIGQQADVATYKGYVYTAKPNAKLTTTIFNKYEATQQYNILPTVVFDHKSDKNYVAPSTGSNKHCYYNEDTKQLEISFDQGENKVYDPNILDVSKVGNTLGYTVKINGVDYTGKTITFDRAGTYTAVYTYADPHNFRLNNSGDEVESFAINYEQVVNIVVSVVEETAKNAEFTFYGYSSISKTEATKITDVKSVTSNSGNIYIMPSVTGTYVTSKTIDGITVNCPRVYVDFKDNSSDFNWLYPVFLGVEIKDYANGGTANTATTIVSPTSTSKPTNLTILTIDKPSGGGGWSSGSGKSGSEGTISSGTYKNLYGWTSGALGSDQPANSIYCQFTYKDNKGTTYYYVIEFYREAHTCPSCVTPDTLITLADGSQVRVDSLTGSEQLLVWNMETGSLDSAPIMFVDSEVETTREVIKLHFSDGTEVKVISEHGFWDYDLNKYVYLDRNAIEYIGHTFAKQDGNKLSKVTLVDVVLESQVTTAWSPVTAGHLCYFVNGMLSMPGGVGGLFNIFDVDAETMTYDYEAMVRDIETYGLFTYEELSQYGELSREMFDAAGGQYLKVSIGKGNLTEEELIAMIERYSKYFE